MEDKVLKIVCGFQSEANNALREELRAKAKQKGYDVVCVSRYRKEGVRQFLLEHEDFGVVVLQEALQGSSPYTAEDLAELVDERDVNVIVSLSRTHFGNRYMKLLYASGITNALFEEDAFADNIVKLMLAGRSRKDCRRYYGIETMADVEKTLEAVDEDRVSNYLDYVENGGPPDELESRYDFVVGSLKLVENAYLVRQMPPVVASALSGNKEYRYFRGLDKGKRVHLPRWGKGNGIQPKSRQGRNESEATKGKETRVQGRQINEPLAQIQNGAGGGDNKAAIEEDISDLLGLRGLEERESRLATTNVTMQLEPGVRIDESNPERTTVSKKGDAPIRKSERVLLWVAVGLFTTMLVTIAVYLFLLWGSKSTGVERSQDPYRIEKAESDKSTERVVLRCERGGADEFV